jgi:hypothetical protein
MQLNCGVKPTLATDGWTMTHVAMSQLDAIPFKILKIFVALVF